ncbi:hypothetical protein CKAN_01669200 [Cinnamomum micranthum f. kanehirae]|uniref:Uncharacterized protein n=1 Tax=Cinnamomum micranthum f. kanehirae TaxID=337451 RepID=A0A3S3NHI7_9MAGN|nr:hypothetical protein CKAN_01669200 [Cinnamomum micranthum f. kanehirae]
MEEDVSLGTRPRLKIKEEKIKKTGVTMGARADAPPPLEQTHTECQALELVHPAPYLDTQGASFLEIEHHPLEWTHPVLKRTMREIRNLIRKPLPNFSQNTNLSCTCSTSLEARIKAYT